MGSRLDLCSYAEKISPFEARHYHRITGKCSKMRRALRKDKKAKDFQEQIQETRLQIQELDKTRKQRENGIVLMFFFLNCW